MKTLSVRLFRLAAATVILISAAWAQQIHGVITDPSGAVVSGATVQLLKDGRSLIGAATDSDGKFALSVQVGAIERAQVLELSARAPGFRAFSRRLEWSGKRDLYVPIKLRIAAATEEVAVFAASQSIGSQLEMGEVRDSSAKDLGEALSELDGVEKIRRGGIANDIVVRGLQKGNLNVLVDGSRTFAACPGRMDPPASHVDFAEVERVDVLKGPYDVTNQGSLGAIINVVTKTPGPGLQIKPSFSTASYNYYNPSITAAYGADAFKLLLGYSFRNSDPYKDGSGKPFTSYSNYSSAVRDRKSFDINSGWFQAEYDPAKNQKLSLSYTRQVSGLVLYPYLTMDADYDRADRAILKYQVKDLPHSVRALRLETYFTQVQHYMSDRLRTTAQPTTWKMASDAQSRAIGGRIEADLLSDFTLGIESYYRNWNMWGFSNTGGSITTSSAIPDVDNRSTGAFLVYHHRLSHALRLNGGIRFDHATTRVGTANFDPTVFYLYQNTRLTRNVNNYPSGNLRLTWAATKILELFVGAGTTGRLPDAEERYINRKTVMGANIGNPLLPITRNTEADAGLTLTYGRCYLRPSLFYSKFSDFIVVNDQPRINPPAPGMMWPLTARSYQNIDARIYGGEISYALAFRWPISLSGGASYSRGIGDPKPQVGIFSTNLPEMPPLRTWAALRYVRGTMFGEIGGTAVARQKLIDLDLKETATPGYGTMNVRLGFTHKGWNGSFMVENLLNRLYYEHLSYYRDPDFLGVRVPEPGRTFFAQLKYNFQKKSQ